MELPRYVVLVNEQELELGDICIGFKYRVNADNLVKLLKQSLTVQNIQVKHNGQVTEAWKRCDNGWDGQVTHYVFERGSDENLVSEEDFVLTPLETDDF
jgi:hypothetical protein